MSATPGPWKSVQFGYHRDFRVVDETEKLIAVVGNAEPHQEAGAEWEANARLIAAAPTMLAALKGLVRYAKAARMSVGMGKHQVERLEAARAAIKEAGGRAP